MNQNTSNAAGLILQRGGEELLLAKVPDRFSTQLVDPEAITALQETLSPLAVRSVARGQLVEWTVPPQQLEQSLAQVRTEAVVQFASHVYQLITSPQTWIYLTDQITVQFAPLLPRAHGEAIARPQGLTRIGALAGIPNTFIYQVTNQATENPIKIANHLMAHDAVLTAEPNVVVQTAALYQPQDALYTRQWHLSPTSDPQVNPDSHIAVERAWDVTRGSRSVVIAVSDDGFDLEHPDLQGMGKLVAPYDLQADDAVPLPMTRDDNHGTSCAGLAIGEENRQGIVGVAPGCGFMPIRTTGFLDDASIEGLFQWALDQGAAVISCSWSPASIYFPLSLRQRHVLTRAATQGRDGKGCVIVFSAGNANRPVSGTINEDNWPQNAVSGQTTWLSGFAVHPDVITVSACTSLNKKAAYSSWGEHIAVTAPSNNAAPSVALPKIGTVQTGPLVKSSLPGRGVVTSDRTGTAGYNQDAYTTTFGGTSSSCPMVAGVAGLILSANPTLTAREVKQILQQTADKIIDTTSDPQLGLRHGTYDQDGHSQWFGYGRVNAHQAVLEAKRRLWPQRGYTDMIELMEAIAISIPDNQPSGITRPLRCRTQGRVQDLYIQVNLDHEFLGDITLHLQPPIGQPLLLQGRTLGNRQSLRQRYDLSNTPGLIAAIGNDAAGLWYLQVKDHAPSHTGQLLSWTLKLAVQAQAQ